MEWLMNLKTLLISIGLLFMALGLRFSVPSLMDFLTSHVPTMWNFVLSWLKPPYLYVMINFIIIFIVASSRFQKGHKQSSIDNNPQTETAAPPLHDVQEASTCYYPKPPSLVEVQVRPQLLASQYQPHSDEEEKENALAPELVKFVIVEEDNVPDMAEAEPDYLSPAEKHIVSERLGHGKPRKIRQGGRELTTWERGDQHETMENTWKAIMKKKSTSLSRQATEHDTWENMVTVAPLERRDATKETEKCRNQTHYTECTARLAPSYSKLRKEPSPSQDELNGRVEEFIRKINEDMRLQREESLDQYMKMIDREK